MQDQSRGKGWTGDSSCVITGVWEAVGAMGRETPGEARKQTASQRRYSGSLSVTVGSRRRVGKGNSPEMNERESRVVGHSGGGQEGVSGRRLVGRVECWRDARKDEERTVWSALGNTERREPSNSCSAEVVGWRVDSRCTQQRELAQKTENTFRKCDGKEEWENVTTTEDGGRGRTYQHFLIWKMAEPE